MATRTEISSSIPHEFPQPSRPFNLYDTNIDYMAAETRFLDPNYFHGSNDHEENILKTIKEDDSHHTLRKFIERLDEKGHDMLKKLVSKDVTIERLLRETLHELKGAPISHIFDKFIEKLNSREMRDENIVERGVDGNNSGYDREELERFKVKTVNIVGVGVVKEDDHDEQ